LVIGFVVLFILSVTSVWISELFVDMREFCNKSCKRSKKSNTEIL